MDISLFYQLKERLYSTAMAGCAVINEDFRLKRAVEEFEPLAKANKVFAKLYGMCNELFTSDNPAPLLVDCIALCDALAVTQGTFSDNSNATESEGIKGCVPCNVRYSEMPDGSGHYSNFASLVDSFSPEKYRDTRIMSIFLDSIGKNYYAESYIEKYIMSFGKDIVPVLKGYVDINEKNSAKLIDYIGKLAESAENDWYWEIAKNEECIKQLRISAIKALAYDKDNFHELLELWRISKGDVKNACAYALVSNASNEAEEVLQKITSCKITEKNTELIEISSHRIAVDFAVDYAEKFIAGENNCNFNTACIMLSNKPDVSDTILRLMESVPDNATENILLIDTRLISNINRHKDEKFRTLIETLYTANPERFASAYLYMGITEGRGINTEEIEINYYLYKQTIDMLINWHREFLNLESYKKLIELAIDYGEEIHYNFYYNIPEHSSIIPPLYSWLKPMKKRGRQKYIDRLVKEMEKFMKWNGYDDLLKGNN